LQASVADLIALSPDVLIVAASQAAVVLKSLIDKGERRLRRPNKARRLGTGSDRPEPAGLALRNLRGAVFGFHVP
jgi:hypothetical protein